MKVYLGSSGIICPLGNSVSEVFGRMISGESGIVLHQNAFGTGIDAYVGVTPDKYIPQGNQNKIYRMLSGCFQQSLSQCNYNPFMEKDGLVIICTTKGNITAFEQEKPEAGLLADLGLALQQEFNLYHTPFVISNACISGLSGIINAGRLVRSGKYRHIMVLGADLASAFTLTGFQSFMALAGGICKPYDKNREGLNLGEAAASLVLSADESLNKKNIASWLGGSTANDANHISGPSRTGEGLFRAVSQGMAQSKISSEEIDFICAHGTATPYNDEMESIAFNRCGLQETPVNSLKAFFGHTLGVAALLETVISLHSMEKGEIIASKGYEEHGVTQPLNVLKENKKGNYRVFLKTASGFGGSNAAALFQKI